jgi:Tol biopolymer transport system component
MRSTRAFALALLLGALCFTTPVRAQQVAPAGDTSKKTAPNSELPILPTRQAAFTTDEGTWMSLDVSPDGKTIVFDLVGDLYSVPIGGGKATRLTSGMGFDGQPRYSPDGTTIVFVSDRSGYENLWLIDADGKNPRALTKDKDAQYISPAWSPDGKYLVVSRSKTGILGSAYDMVLINKEGGTGMQLTGPGTGAPASGPPSPLSPPPFNNYLGASVTPDNRYIYAAVKRGGFKYDQMLDDRFQIGVYDRNTGKTYLRTTALGGGMRPAVSPDGKWLAFGSRLDNKTGLRLRNLSSGDEVLLARDIQRDDSESRYTRDLMPGYAWTPDSKSVVLTYGGKLWRLSVPDGKATPVPFTADVQIDMGPLVKSQYPVDDSVLTVKQIRNTRPSPDGKKLVFSALDKLWLMDLPNGKPRRLTGYTGGEHSPAWSPDGKWIAYVTWTEQGGDIWRISPAGRGARPERLSRQSAFYEDLNYEPTGRRIVVVRGPRGERIEKTDEFTGPGPQVKELVWLPAEGGEVTQIAPLNYAYGRPHFTHDTTRVYIYDPTEGVVSMRWDGTDRRAHVKITGYTDPSGGPDARPGAANEVVLSPDGDQAFADIDNKLYLVAVPVTGGQTPTISISNPAAAPVPERRITRVGGDFLGWTQDGKSVYWSLGHSYFAYDVAAANRAVADSTRRADSLTRVGAKPDTSPAAKKPAYAANRLDVTITAAKDRPTGSIVLRNARIVTMKGNEVIEHGDIVVTNNRIAAVGPTGSLTIPAGARSVDVSGTTIIPGWVDIHAHMWPTWGIHKTQVYEYLVNLAYGVTTTRDPQTSTTDVLTYGDLVETGDMLGPRIFTTGPGVFWSDDLSSLDDAREVLTRYSDFYQTHTLKQYMSGQRMIRQWILMAAKEQNITPTLEGGLDFKKNLTEAIDGYAGSEHAYPITPLFKDVVSVVAQSGITYTPTLIVQYGGPFAEDYWFEHYDIHGDAKLQRFTPHQELDRRGLRRPGWFADSEYSFNQIAAQAAKIVAAGGRVGLGGHGEMQGLGVHWELWSIATGGMPNHDVLRVGTIFGAEAIGVGKDIGSIEAGKLADLQVLDKNPLENIRNTTSIRYVMKNGRLYDANTLAEVAPRAKSLDRMWWVVTHD